MSPTKSNDTIAPPGWMITRVTLDVQHPMLYANGREQARVVVYIEAQQDSQPVKLTLAEKAGVRLIDYTAPDAAIPLAEATSGDTYKGWASQHDYQGFLFHPATSLESRSALEAPLPKAAGEYLEFFLTADHDALSTPLSVAFVVAGDNGWRYRTDGYVFSPEGVASYNSLYDTGSDKKVRAEAPAIYTPDQVRLDRRYTDRDADNDVNRDALFNDTVTLSIQNGSGTVALRSMHCVPAGMIHWEGIDPSTQNPCYTGYAQPGETTVHWNPSVPIGGQPRPTLSTPVPGKGVIMLCGRIDIRRGDHIDPPQGPLEVHMVDAYGSDQRCSVAFVSGTRDDLKVS